MSALHPRVLLLGLEPALRVSLHAALADDGAETIVGRSFDWHVTRFGPDVVVIDTDALAVEPEAAVRELAATYPGCAIVVLSDSDDEELARDTVLAGAAGFLRSDLPVAALCQTVFGAAGGEAAISRSLTLAFIDQLRSVAHDAGGDQPNRESRFRRDS